MDNVDRTAEQIKIVEQVKPLAAQYYHLTGKPLGITGEIGEIEVARLLGLKLAKARTPGYDAMDRCGCRRYQVKSRSLSAEARKKSQMIGTMYRLDQCDAVLLAILDENFEVLGIWEAGRAAVKAALDEKGSKGRNQRRQLSVSKFKNIGRCRYRHSNAGRA